MVDSDHESQPEIRKRLVENDENIQEGQEIIKEEEKEEINHNHDNDYDELKESFIEEVEADEKAVEDEKMATPPKVTVYGGIRNLQPPQRPSFISRQATNVKVFFAEFIDFIFLFLTTLFNPMSDVNVQVQEYKDRKTAREGRYFSSQIRRSAPYQGCGPSS